MYIRQGIKNNMKQILVLCALLAVASCGVWKGGFRIRFDVGIGIGSSFFYELPLTITDAVLDGWVLREPPAGLPVTSVELYCYPDLVVCNFYNSNGDVAGMQIALPEADLTDIQYDMEETGFTKWTALRGTVETTFWTIQQYFATEEELRSRAVRDNTNQIISNGGVWVTGVRKELLLIHNTTDAIVDEAIFTRQACIPWMGRHYYYKMTPQTSCVTEPVYPWFAIVESGELVATGFMVFAKLNLPSGARNWFENPPETAVKVIVPDGPQCIYDLSAKALLTMHIYYVDQPWLVSCILQ